MKKIFTSVLFSTFTLTSWAEPIQISIAEPLKQMGIERQFYDGIKSGLGNSSSVSLEFADFTLDGSERIPASVGFRIHSKQRTCVPKPWPLEGHWCTTTYDVSTSLRAYFALGPGCQVTEMDIKKCCTDSSGLVSAALEGILHEVWKLAEVTILNPFVVQIVITNKIRSTDHPQIKRLCGN